MRWRVRAAVWALPAILVLAACGQRSIARPPGPSEMAVHRPVAEGSTGGGGRPEGVRDEGRPPGRDPVAAGGEAGEPEGVVAAEADGLLVARGARGTGHAARRQSQRLAVVIGIDDYPGNDDDLEAAAADARLMRRTLAGFGFDRMVVLINGDASREAILWAAGWLARESRPGGVGAFFYAGHVRRIAGDPDGDGEDVDEAMVGADDRLVYDGELARALEGARGRLWLGYAACYAAGFSDVAGPRRVSSYASDEASLAYESKALGHSFMVEYLVRRAMRHAGISVVEEAHARAVRQMRGDVKRFRPLVDDRVRGGLDLAEPVPIGPSPDYATAQACLVVFRCRN